MSSDRSALRTQYRSALQSYVEGGREEGLQQAYELGRRAIAEGLGVLEMAELQGEVLDSVLAGSSGTEARGEAVRSAWRFFLESLSPYEITHRGFREANTALRRLNDLLEEQAKRIAHALHDDAGQLLVSVHLTLEEIARDLEPDDRLRLQRVRQLLDEIEERLRDFSHELRPTVLDDLGLIAAMRFLAQSVADRSGLSVHVEAPLEQRLPPPLETALYRILQETLNNVVKHSEARQVRVTLRRQGGALLYIVQDDGAGFDPEAAGLPGSHRGLGLLGIRERVDALRGTLDIRSAPGRGTEVHITIPLEA